MRSSASPVIPVGAAVRKALVSVRVLILMKYKLEHAIEILFVLFSSTKCSRMWHPLFLSRIVLFCVWVCVSVQEAQKPSSNHVTTFTRTFVYLLPYCTTVVMSFLHFEGRAFGGVDIPGVFARCVPYPKFSVRLGTASIPCRILR